MNQTYVDTVRLLLAIAPAVFASGRFAMKGGTALNLFVQQMPRLSVDRTACEPITPRPPELIEACRLLSRPA
jgi:hypothetical protein